MTSVFFFRGTSQNKAFSNQNKVIWGNFCDICLKRISWVQLPYLFECQAVGELYLKYIFCCHEGTSLNRSIIFPSGAKSAEN